MARPKGTGGQSQVMSKEQIQLVADELARDPVNGQRNRTIWLLGVLTGCRVGEILTLRVRDVWAFGNSADRRSLSQIFLDGTRTKTHTSCTIPIGSAERRVILEWMLRRGPCAPGDFLFPGRYPRSPLSYDKFRKDLVAARERLGLPRLRTHSMRRTCGTQALRMDGNLRHVQEKLRHKNLKWTQVYTEVDEQEMATHADDFGAYLEIPS